MNTNPCLKRSIAIICILFAFQSYAQKRMSINSSGEVIELQGDGNSNFATFTQNGKTRTKSFPTQVENNQNANIKYIVTFKGLPPVFIRNQAQQSSNQRSYQQSEDRLKQLDQFLLSQNNKSTAASGNSTSPESKILKGYEKAIYGAFVEMTEDVANDVRQLKYVKSVTVSKKYEAILEQSVPLIGADQFWEQYDFTGEGVVVGIMDTGIDYNHEALGGGYGIGFKVFDGYDFVNQDDDPMDDHFHGTHVAGIVAGNGGEITGVAPDASLVALKVLDSYGSGSEHDIIEAIEWTMDPNGDGNFEDRLDIVNMSLGGYGHPEDPMSVAVNNAVSVGVVYCIAAGNGSTNFNISSPGTAESAITVGASDKSDELAYFSSKGPNKENFHIKPDIVAPGVDIYSAMLNDSYTYLNGTSMATPHIAGVAALLVGINPDLNPSEVKSAMTTTAIDLGLNVMNQGSGRVDVMAASEVSSFLYPTNISFGLNDVKSDNWTKSTMVTVQNNAGESQSYSVELNEFPSGVNVTVSSESFTLESGASLDLEFDINVDNSVFQLEYTPSLTYSDFITISGDVDELKLPWAFTSGAIATVKFDQWSWSDYFFLVGENSIHSSWDKEVIDNQIDVLVTPGIYDLVVIKGNAQQNIIKEEINIDRSETIEVYSSDASNSVLLSATDENGNEFKSANSTSVFILNSEKFSLSFSNGLLRKEYQFSDFSDRFSANFKTVVSPRTNEDQKVYDISYGYLPGLQSDTTISFGKDDLYYAEIVHNLPGNDTIDFAVVFETDFQYDDEGNIVNWFGFGTSVDNIPNGHWTIDYYGTNQVIDEFNRKPGIITMAYDESGTELNPTAMVIEAPNVSVIDGEIGILRSKYPDQGTPMYSSGSRIELGNGLQHIGDWFNDSEFHPRGQSGELMGYGPLQYPDYLDNGNLIQIKGDTYYDWNEGTGIYQYDLSMNGEESELVILPNSLQLIGEDGKVSPSLLKSIPASINYNIDHYPHVEISDTKVYYRIHGSEEYTLLDTEQTFEGDERSGYTVALPENLEYGVYDFQLEANSTSGYTMTWKMEPAFKYSPNDIPEITGQNEITIANNQTYTFDMSDLYVSDSDNLYPLDFTLTIFESEEYIIDGTTIIPQDGFMNPLTVPILVSDGTDDSEVFDFLITVDEADAPIITGQHEKEVFRFEAFMIYLDDLIVDFPEDYIADDVTLHIEPGSDYDIYDGYIHHYLQEPGELTVKLYINDGNTDSDIFHFKVQVKNFIPEIYGHRLIEIDKNSSYVLSIDDLYYTDLDNYSHGIIVLDGENYTLEGTTITPIEDFVGALKVDVMITDYIDNSAPFTVNIDVGTSIPVIVDQTSDYSITRSETFTISMDYLIVDDSDSEYPGDFTLEVLEGEHFAIENDYTIVPEESFAGELSIPVRVSDGINFSDTFDFKLDVINDIPEILSQSEITIEAGTSYTLSMDDLEVVDGDAYDQSRLELMIYQGDHYSYNRLVVTPDPDFLGELTVNIVVFDGHDISDVFELLITVSGATVTDIDDVLNQFKIFPNPVEQFVYLEVGVAETTKFQITDISGAIMKSGVLKAGTNNINIETFNPGIYVVQLINNQMNASKRIMKK